MRIVFLISTLLLAAAWPGPANAGENHMTVLPTRYDFTTLVVRLDKAIAANKMFVVTRASASKGAAGRGIKIPGNMVVGVYRNDFAVRMLKASIAAGIEAPIRFYITENKTGTATLRYRKPSVVFAPYTGGPKLTALAGELDEIFGRIAKAATGP